ncbi:MAG: TIR domain-containing protein, partial [Undibacterium sp.]|nr:TIR domain-containing protein [Opitutaceae bacterium]
MSASANHAVFLSYASQDAAAVLRIAEALRASGAEVWFDKNELVGGDAWDAKIRGQIAACALFVPVISAATQARGGGYFRLEWKLAVDRSHLMAHDQPFLLPVVVDATADAAARVPPEFRAVQWTRLPGGETPEKFCERVGKLLGRESGTGILPVFSGHGQDARATSELVGASLDGARGRGRAAPRPKSSRSWLVPAIIGVVAVAALALWQPWKKSAPAVPPRPAAVAPSALSLTPAQQLVAKARTILEQGDELNRETYALAEELLVKAEALDVMEASAWVLHARVSASRIEYGLDRSAARYEALRMQTGRAVQLAPGSLDVQLAEVDAAIAFEQNIPAVILRLQALAVKHPDDWIIQDQLSQCYRLVGKLSEGLAANERALQLSPENPRLKSNRINFLIVFRRWAEAETAIAAMLQGRTGARLLVHDVYLKLLWSGDLAGAATAVRSWPAWFLLEDRGVVNAAYVALWNRDPGTALAAVRKFPRDYISDYLFTGPSAVLSAWANEAASNVESARADWRTVQQVAERQLRAAPGDPYALHWKAWALARLGDTPAATSILQQLLEKNYDMSAMGQFVGRLGGLAVTVGRTDLALAQIAQNPPGVRAITKTDLRLNPLFDPLRSDPRFQAVIDAAVGPPEKKEVVAAPAVMPNDKSVAVLAFANLSDDKGNEYFSDGISEELLNVLAKVPGLKVSARTSAFYFKGKQ